MINPATLYTVRNKDNNDILLKTTFYQHVLDLNLDPQVIEKGSVMTMEHNNKQYVIDEITFFEYKSEQLYLKSFPYNFDTLILVRELT